MASFLITIEKSEKVMEVIWSEPAFIISRHLLFSDVFVEEDKAEIKRLIELGFQKEEVFQCNSSLRLASDNTKFRICFMQMLDQLLVYALDDQMLERDECQRSLQIISHKFMQSIKSYSESNLFHSTKSISSQFEKIQMLNNELINTKRLLEKANAQLGFLNQDLNNRLVKDALTGLVSRYQYRAEIDMLIKNDPNKKGVFIFIDIDNFKSVNDNYGHSIGDKYLIEFAERLKSLPFEKSIKLRISGDEFGLFIYCLNEINSDKIINYWNIMKEFVLSENIKTDGLSLPISISAGVSIYGIDTKEIYELIEFADFAMYAAKRKGKNCLSIFNKSEYNIAKRKKNENK